MATLESGRKNMYVERICLLSSDDTSVSSENKKTQLELFYDNGELVVNAYGKSLRTKVPVYTEFPEVTKTDDVLNYGNFSTASGSENNSTDATIIELKPLFLPEKKSKIQKENKVTSTKKEDKVFPAEKKEERKTENKTEVKTDGKKYDGDDDYEKYLNQSKKTKYTIGGKLIGIISTLVVISLGLITLLVSYFVTKDVRINAEDNNLTLNERSADSAENLLGQYVNSVKLFLSMAENSTNDDYEKKQIALMFFDANSDVAFVALPESQHIFVNKKYFIENEIDEKLVTNYLSQSETEIANAENGEEQVYNVSPVFRKEMLSIFYPLTGYENDSCFIFVFSSEKLSKGISSGNVNTTFIVNKDGDVLVHPDYDLVLQGKNLLEIKIVEQMLSSSESNRQLLYIDNSGDEYFGAYKKINPGNCGVITTVKSSIVYEGVNATTRRNLYLLCSVLAIAIIIVFLFSKSISQPVKALASAAEDIMQGNFNVKLHPRSKDEIGNLTQNFVEMGKGLAERENLKTAFGKFTNKAVAEKAMRGELALGGETKVATVFFSDIRSFTAISEKLEPFEVVGFLNDYMTRMVECVDKTGGVVDKYIGDAVMAVWDAPVSTGSPKDDALNCVKAALLMRKELIKFNQGRGPDKNPIIKIGCGINTGPLIAGQIGSVERMEYTVIGDAVNTASRTESLNKPLGTDILITEDTWKLIKEYVLVEEMPAISVKGKTNDVRMFAVINLVGQSGPKTLKEVRSLLNIPEPDLSKVNVNEEEKKYKIKGK